MTLPFSNSLLSGIFAVNEAARLFSDESRVQAMLDFEAALARAEGSLGIVPADAAATITSCCRVERIDLSRLGAELIGSGNLAIPLVRQLTNLVRRESEQAAGFVHWGATSQDVIDTGLVLQLRVVLNFTMTALDKTAGQLARLCRTYAQTPMAGRTWMQQAVPITFGLKAAGWLSALLRDRERLVQMQARLLVLQFGGAAGTLASLGERGLEVANALAEELELALPELPWHGARDRVAEAATVYGLMSGTLGKIARDLSIVMQTEIAEVAEGSGADRGGSSTMPHKRNPVGVAAVIACTLRVPALVATMLAAMPQESERGLGGWGAEWETLPAICTLTLSALAHLEAVLTRLEVFPDAMLRNLDVTNGLLMAEAVSMQLAAHMGRDQAHKLMQEASRRAIADGLHLKAVVQSEGLITKHLNVEQIDSLFEPSAYLGTSAVMIERVLAQYAKSLGPENG